MSKYESKLESFISNNAELVGEYESMECAAPLEYCDDEVIDFLQEIIKKDKTTDFNSALTTALQSSIRYNTSITDSLESMLNSINSDSRSFNSTQQYFKEINDIYLKHNNDYNIEYCPENREKLIEMNLKAVISIAKKYQGLGLTLEELISAGNLGLVIAWDKFDPNRSKLKDQVMDAIKDLPEEFEYKVLADAVHEYMEYGDIKKKFIDKFHQGETYTKKEIIKWVNSNIFNAKFNSIATMWIRAYILIEIDNYSRVVKKPKSEIYRDREKFGAYKKEITLDIDAPVSSDSDTVFGDLLKMEDDTYSDLEVSEAYDIYKSSLNKLLHGVKPRDRAIFLKKFGIGLPRPMLPKEIADQEGLSIARISQIFQTVVDQIQQNQVKFGIDPDVLFEAVKKFK
jgi:DNA-directed RNA polymerase sigma subunit (sigma70/sigma32)